MGPEPDQQDLQPSPEVVDAVEEAARAATEPAIAGKEIERVGQRPLPDPIRLGEILAASNYFDDATEAAQAAVKVMAGQELGFGPVASMTSIHVFRTNEGTQIQVGGNLLAAKVKQSEKYDYRTVQWTHEICEVAFYERDPVTGQWVEQDPHITWDLNDARQANLAHKQNWKGYTRKMLFWRCMSDGVDLHCPDLFSGVPVYIEDEIQPGAEAAPGPRPAPARTGLPPRAEARATPQTIQGREAPATSARAPGKTEPKLNAAQLRKLWAEAEKHGLKEREDVLRALMLDTTGTRHGDRIERRYFDALLEAIADADAHLDALMQRAREGEDRARRVIAAAMGDDAVPALEKPPPPEDVGETPPPSPEDENGGQDALL